METKKDMLYAYGRAPLWLPHPDHPPYLYCGISHWEKRPLSILNHAHRVTPKSFGQAIERIEARIRQTKPQYDTNAIRINRCLIHGSTAVWQAREGGHPYFYCGQGRWTYATDGEALLSQASSIGLKQFHRIITRTDQTVSR